MTWGAGVIKWGVKHVYLGKEEWRCLCCWLSGVTPLPWFAAAAWGRTSITNELSSLGALPKSPQAKPHQPHTPFGSGPPFPGCRWPVAHTSAPPRRFSVLASPSSQWIFSQRPALKVGYMGGCVSTACDSAVVQVSYLLGTCQKPQMFLKPATAKGTGSFHSGKDNVCSRLSCKLVSSHCQEMRAGKGCHGMRAGKPASGFLEPQKPEIFKRTSDTLLYTEVFLKGTKVFLEASPWNRKVF